MSTPTHIRVDGVTYEQVRDLDGKALPAPRLKEPWWYQLVPHGACELPPVTVDGYWHERRMKRERARRMLPRWVRKGRVQVAT